MNGMIGLSGTFNRPSAIVILAPPSGGVICGSDIDLLSWFFAIFAPGFAGGAKWVAGYYLGFLGHGQWGSGYKFLS
jgi:hypothetical protein